MLLVLIALPLVLVTVTVRVVLWWFTVLPGIRARELPLPRRDVVDRLVSVRFATKVCLPKVPLETPR